MGKHLGRTSFTAAAALAAMAAMSMPAPARAQESSGDSPGDAGLSVERAAIAEEIQDREPVGEGTTFPADVGELVCFTKITGAEGETAIYHVWMRGGEEKARVELPVRSSSWRTYSRKKIPAEWAGEWTVKVEDAQGGLLQELAFTVTGPEDGQGAGADQEEESGGGAAGR